MDFCKVLRAVRMKRGFTQPFMADAVGVALRTYQFYEQGKREPNLGMLVSLADVLQVPVDYLLGRDMRAVESFDGYR